ncbi:MAG TPA: DNA-directed RNA polymerase subunit alpha [Candidatus Krumholzibacteria bacterium]|nr:DNA-directed RNA polymerase subunit alpha [Candidatus Krumholzibacteria bacterium]
MKWRNLLMPKEILRDEATATDKSARFVVEPLERGFGLTLGNVLRRTLLSSIQGAAVTAVRIKGVLHELSNIPGVMEDVTDVVLNLKQLVVLMHNDEPRFVKLRVTRQGPITAADIEPDADIEIVNKDLVICTATENVEVEMDILVGHGRGYVAAETHDLGDYDIGLIPLDSNFSPIRKVAYTVENTRVGQRTDYDRLLLDVQTDGSVRPEDALGYAAKIIKDHMLLFIRFDETPMEEQEPEVDEERERLRELMGRSVEELELSVRSGNCLRRANIRTLGELVRRSEPEMLKYRNFGKQSLKEITEILAGMGLHLGMDVDGLLGGKSSVRPATDVSRDMDMDADMGSDADLDADDDDSDDLDTDSDSEVALEN